MQVRVQKGLDVSATAGPQGGVAKPTQVSTVGILGCDYPGVTFDLHVAMDDAVAAGQALCADRHRPDIRFVAPVAGRVSHIKLGARRRLEALEITVEGEAALTFDVDRPKRDDAALRDLLLTSGAWTSFRTRPFGLVPDPDSQPAAIFVTSTDTNPMAADPVAVLTPDLAQFTRGVDALLRLTAGTVFICQPPVPPLVAAAGRLQVAHFSGPHPAGLAGTQIHHLLPASRHRTVWQIGYQDVVAIGYLLETGRIMTQRRISLAGSGVAHPTLIRAPLGARLADLVTPLGQAHSDESTVLLSGSVLSGQKTRFLRRHDLQVTAVNRPVSETLKRPFWHRWMDALPVAKDCAVLPLEAFDRAFPFDLLPVPLMRALAVADTESAERLGCLELLEEDLALLGWLCPSGSDYGALLRQVLDLLAREAVQ